jgi:hypothetical protein
MKKLPRHTQVRRFVPRIGAEVIIFGPFETCPSILEARLLVRQLQYDVRSAYVPRLLQSRS